MNPVILNSNHNNNINSGFKGIAPNKKAINTWVKDVNNQVHIQVPIFSVEVRGCSSG